MKKKVYIIFYLPVFLCLIFLGCSKSKTSEEVKNNSEPGQVLRLTPGNCPNPPDYGDSIICEKWQGPNRDYLVKPKNNPGAGSYFAWPQGLVINQQTGEINVSQSEAGARYIIGFLKDGSTDTCFTEIIIAGVTYLDGVYVLQNNDTLALPYFNANPVRTPVCDDSGGNDYPTANANDNANGNDKCEFDDGYDDDNGNGYSDEPPPGQQANSRKVRVRTISGIIDLKKSLNDGAFGSNPQNGDTREVTIYYRLNDCSAKALRKMKIKLTYYNKRSEIPVQTLSTVETNYDAFMSYRIVDGKPRPPQIFITRYY